MKTREMTGKEILCGLVIETIAASICILPPVFILAVKGADEKNLKDLKDFTMKYRLIIIACLVALAIFINIKYVKILIHSSIPHGEYFVAINIIAIKVYFLISVFLLAWLLVFTYLDILIRFSRHIPWHIVVVWLAVSIILDRLFVLVLQIAAMSLGYYTA